MQAWSVTVRGKLTIYTFLNYANSELLKVLLKLDGQVIRASAFGDVDSDLIPSRVKPMIFF